jgi:hypothetical protein
MAAGQQAATFVGHFCTRVSDHFFEERVGQQKTKSRWRRHGPFLKGQDGI